MSETASRRLFLGEVVLLALPSLVFMATYAVLFGTYALIGAGAMVVNLLFGDAKLRSLDDAWAFLQLTGIFFGSAVIAVFGLVAIAKFLGVALGFWRSGRAGLADFRRTFWRGLAFAALPLAIMVPFGWIAASGEHGVDKIVAIYASGLALGVPILHLWLEMRHAAPDRSVS